MIYVRNRVVCVTLRNLRHCVYIKFKLTETHIPLCYQFSSVAQSCLTLCSPMHARLPCPSPTPRVYSNSCPLSRWCHPTISSSVVHFSSCPQSFPASGSFPVSQFFTSGGQSIRALASASVLPMNNYAWMWVYEKQAERSGISHTHTEFVYVQTSYYW